MRDRRPPRLDPVPVLEGLVGADAPAAAPGFADDLEARLRVRHAGLRHRAGHRAGTDGWRGALALGALALVGLVVVALLVAREGPATVELLDARDVTVLLPDGTEFEAEAGLGLPPGTVLTTGPDGFARFEFGTVGPGATVELRDGRVEVLDEPAAVRGRAETPRPIPSDPPRPPPAPTIAARAEADTAPVGPPAPPPRAPVVGDDSRPEPPATEPPATTVEPPPERPARG